MDNQSYLDQISQQTRPIKQSGFSLSNLFSSAIVKYVAIFIGAMLVIVILGAFLGASNNSQKENIISLKLHVDNLSSTINTYHTSLKNSNLRGASSSLKTILSETSKSLNSYLETKYEYTEKDIPESITASETTLQTELENNLFEAKINGLLDRTYARKMAYEISIITNRESSIYENLKDDTLRNQIKTSYDNLANLYDSFDSFSESK